MAKINSLMDVGKRGMAVSQSALQTTSHNIANKSTEGYSRQRVDIVTNPPADEGRFRIGTGATTGSINRVNNPWLEKQIEKEGASFAFLESQTEAMKRIESVLNEQTVKGLNNALGDFFNSFRELANNPESTVARTVVRDTAGGMIRTFQDLNRQISSISDDMNKTIEAGLSEVNAYVKEIASLNKKIQEVEIQRSAQANDERDRRDLLLKKLSEKLDISYSEDTTTGMLNINAGRTGVLVAGTSSSELKHQKDPDGRTQIMYELSKGGSSVDITDQFQRGSIGGVINLRDGLLTDMKTELEELSYKIATEVNNAHAEGYDRYNIQGVSFFEVPRDGNYSVDDLKLNKVLTQDVGRIAVAAKPNSPGDNSIANVIHSLQFKKTMGEGQSTFDEFYNSRVGQIGIFAQRATSGMEAQKNIVDQLKNTRESVSGVSLDEEAAKMIEFQKSFEASARVIKMADEMFDTIINLKRY